MSERGAETTRKGHDQRVTCVRARKRQLIHPVRRTGGRQAQDRRVRQHRYGPSDALPGEVRRAARRRAIAPGVAELPRRRPRRAPRRHRREHRVRPRSARRRAGARRRRRPGLGGLPVVAAAARRGHLGRAGFRGRAHRAVRVHHGRRHVPDRDLLRGRDGGVPQHRDGADFGSRRRAGAGADQPGRPRGDGPARAGVPSAGVHVRGRSLAAAGPDGRGAGAVVRRGSQVPVQQRLRVGVAAAEDWLDRGRRAGAGRAADHHAGGEGRGDRRAGWDCAADRGRAGAGEG